MSLLCAVVMPGLLKVIIVQLLCVQWALCGWNEQSRAFCHPSDFPNEGDGYCAGRLEGWFDGGAMNQMNPDRGDWGTCQKFFKGCQCADCRNSMTGCVDYRCDDETDVRMSTDHSGKCYKAGTTEEKNERMYDFCYEETIRDCKTIVGKCSVGQYLKGCKRATPGVCEDCPVALAVGKYWAKSGYGVTSCVQKTCSVPEKGQYIETPCAAGKDAVIYSCAKYPGNKQAVRLSQEQDMQWKSGVPNATIFSIDRFYCPFPDVARPLPDNAITLDYITYQCKPGYYLQDGACLQCLPGHACASNIKFQCPINYYTNNYASTACKRCNYDCETGRKPLRCAAGSTVNAACVSCGACGGLQCVQSTYDLSRLKESCTPSNSSVVWSCIK